VSDKVIFEKNETEKKCLSVRRNTMGLAPYPCLHFTLLLYSSLLPSSSLMLRQESA